jgi:hypothetical protein
MNKAPNPGGSAGFEQVPGSVHIYGVHDAFRVAIDRNHCGEMEDDVDPVKEGMQALAVEDIASALRDPFVRYAERCLVHKDTDRDATFGQSQRQIVADVPRGACDCNVHDRNS